MFHYEKYLNIQAAWRFRDSKIKLLHYKMGEFEIENLWENASN